jgi:hypothetical protein
MRIKDIPIPETVDSGIGNSGDNLSLFSPTALSVLQACNSSHVSLVRKYLKIAVLEPIANQFPSSSPLGNVRSKQTSAMLNTIPFMFATILPLGWRAWLGFSCHVFV